MDRRLHDDARGRARAAGEPALADDTGPGTALAAPRPRAPGARGVKLSSVSRCARAAGVERARASLPRNGALPPRPAPRPCPALTVRRRAARGARRADAVVVDPAHGVLPAVCPVVVLDAAHVRALVRRRVGAHADVHLDNDRQPHDGA